MCLCVTLINEMYEEEHGLIILGAHDLQKMAEEFVLIMILFYSQAEACAECAAVIEECSKAADKLYEYMIPVVKVMQSIVAGNRSASALT